MKQNQLDLFESRERRDKGMGKAEDHAEKVHDDWKALAYDYLVNYSRDKGEFMIEQVREASKGIVVEPPSKRAWGGITARVVRAGIIKRVGYRSVANPKAHCTPCSVWINCESKSKTGDDLWEEMKKT